MKILHLIDDWVFADGPINAFKTFDVENKFVVLRYGGDKDLKKINNIGDVDVIEIGTEEYQRLIKEDWDVIWVQGYNTQKCRFIADVPKNIIVVWSTWGYDYVQYSGQWLFGFRTTLLWLRKTSIRTIVGVLMKFLAGMLGIARFLPRAECLFFRRVNYYSTVVPNERVFLSRILGRKAEQISFHYITARKSIDQVHPVVSLDSKKIWIGNSATLTNNHLDVFHMLKGHCDGYEILTPVSYTLNGEVRDSVTEAIEYSGRELFGSHYRPIQSFMPFTEYVNLMTTCSAFIFAHKRQQAVGNLVIALRCGGCVFMDSNSPVYKYFTSKGFYIYSLSDIKRGLEAVIKDFSPKQAINMRLMDEVRGRDVLIGEIRESVHYLDTEIRKSL